MEIIIGLGIALVSNILKFAIARFGTTAVQAGLLVVTAIAYYFWHRYGSAVNWTAYVEMLGSAMVWYEFLLKKVWPQATTKAIQGMKSGKKSSSKSGKGGKKC